MNRSTGAFSWRLLVGLGLSGAFLFPAICQAQTRWRLDPDHTTVMFEAPHLGFARIFGFFERVDGEFNFDEESRAITYLRVKVHLDSVFTNNSRRDRELRSPDFLDVYDHPVAEFVMTDADPGSSTTGQIIGDLRFRGITKPVTLDVTLNRIGNLPNSDDYVLGASATTVLKRSDFGSTYAIGKEGVPDEIPVRIEIEAIREGSGS